MLPEKKTISQSQKTVSPSNEKVQVLRQLQMLKRNFSRHCRI